MTDLTGLPSFRPRVDAKLVKVRWLYRVVGVLLVWAGLAYAYTPFEDWIRGTFGTPSVLAALGAGPVLVGGIVLVRQRSPTIHDTTRRGLGITSVAFGPAGITSALSRIAEGTAAAGDIFGTIDVFTLISGIVLSLIGGVCLRSKRFAGWWLEKGQEADRRRQERRVHGG
jgi:hypothetical protein